MDLFYHRPVVTVFRIGLLWLLLFAEYGLSQDSSVSVKNAPAPAVVAPQVDPPKSDSAKESVVPVTETQQKTKLNQKVVAKIGTDVASAILGSFFPNIIAPGSGDATKTESKRQFGPFAPGNGRFGYPRFGGGGFNNFRRPSSGFRGSPGGFGFNPGFPSFSQQYPAANPSGRFQAPGFGSPSSADFFGLNPLAGSPSFPAVNYPFNGPRFGPLSDPRMQATLQQGFPFGGIPGGLQGRTDLPSSYVYPYAKPGAVVVPDNLGSPVFNLNRPGAGPGFPGQFSAAGSPDYSDYGVDFNPGFDPRQYGNNFLFGAPGGFAPSPGFPNYGGQRFPSFGRNFGNPGYPSFLRSQFGKREDLDKDETDPMIKDGDALASQIGSNEPVITVEYNADPKIENQDNLEVQKQQKQEDSDGNLPSCSQCREFTPNKIAGKWTQLIYTALATLTISDKHSDILGSFFTPGCVGLEIGNEETKIENGSEIPISLSYTVNGSYTVHQVKGVLQREDTSPSFVLGIAESFVLPMCLIKGRSATSSNGDYDYMIWMEVVGGSKCRNVHIFARDRHRFHKEYANEVSRYLKQEMESGLLNSVRPLINPQRCSSRSINI